MKISELDESIEGQRIRVTRVAPSLAERMGLGDHVERLTGQTGTAVKLFSWPLNLVTQLGIRWDSPAPGSLVLSNKDEIEII